MVKCLGESSAIDPIGLPSRSSRLQVLPSPVRLTVMSIVGSCRKEKAAPTGSGSSLGGNVQCGQLVLLHGNGSMIQDFESSGLLVIAAKNTASSRSTGRASATASARAPRFGPLRRKQT